LRHIGGNERCYAEIGSVRATRLKPQHDEPAIIGSERAREIAGCKGSHQRKEATFAAAASRPELQLLARRPPHERICADNVPRQWDRHADVAGNIGSSPLCELARTDAEATDGQREPRQVHLTC